MTEHDGGVRKYSTIEDAFAAEMKPGTEASPALMAFFAACCKYAAIAHQRRAENLKREETKNDDHEI